MNSVQSNAPIAVSETEQTHARIRDLLGDCHEQVNQIAVSLQPVLKTEGPVDATASKKEVPPSTPRHAELQSYADSLFDLREKLMRLQTRIEV